MHMRRAGQVVINGLSLLIVAACTLSQPQPTATPPATATATAIPPTATEADTPTPEPTATPDLAATAAVKETEAAAEVIEALAPDLQLAGYDTNQGHLAWFSTGGQVQIRITDYMTHEWVDIADGEVFSDFILKVDVTWESTSGLAVCGLWFRAESYDADASHYLFATLRLSGLPLWDVEQWENNAWVATTSGGGKSTASSHIDQKQGATNTYMLVADGALVTVYANGHRLGQADVNKRSRGVLGYYALQESGETTCSFGNAWVWDLSK